MAQVVGGWRLVVGHLPPNLDFDSRLFHLGCMVDEEALGLCFLRVFLLLPVTIIPPTFRIHSSIVEIV